MPTSQQQDASSSGSGHHVGAISRRGFLGAAAAAAGATALPGCGVLPGFPGGNVDTACEVGPLNGSSRAQRALQIRADAAQQQAGQASATQVCNGDEATYANKIASFSKGLPHNSLGEVDLDAYATLQKALLSGSPQDFENITLGAPSSGRGGWQKLVNPQAGLAFDMEGTDGHQLTIPPAPAFDSAEEAAEIIENYWMALTRDVPFAEYDSNPLTNQAASELSTLTDFKGPKAGGVVTTGTLFRGLTAGDLAGPYISQFLLRPAPFGVQYVEQRSRVTVAGVDYMTTFADWLAVQNGTNPAPTNQFNPTRRYLWNGRDVAAWVHVDVLFQAYFNACLILLDPPNPDLTVGGVGCPLNQSNPYISSTTQIGFGTLGAPYIKATMCEVAARALKAVWYQKWFVHRRLRPEAFAGAVHQVINGAASYPVHPQALNSAAASAIHSDFGSYLLPMAFSEGCPLHPSYGAGHATVAGACVTMLKALFDETFVIPNPMVPDPADPTQLLPYSGDTLTVGGELNKLASNIAIGRNIAGVHWRSDATESLKLGEQVAISVLKDHKICFNEAFTGFVFTGFDGSRITV